MERSDEPTAEAARSAMIDALQSVRSLLPIPVQAGLQVATEATDAHKYEAARLALWDYFDSCAVDSSEALQTRLAVCVLNPKDFSIDVQSHLEYFVDWFRKSGLPEPCLAKVAAMEALYRAHG